MESKKMANQVLDFLDIDLGLYMNIFESSSLDSSSSSSLAVNTFNSNPNLAASVLSECNFFASKQPYHLQHQSQDQQQHNSLIREENTFNVNTNNENFNKTSHKSSFNFQPQVHRTHSYSFSDATPTELLLDNTAQLNSHTNYIRSSSQLLTSELTTAKKALLNNLDKKSISNLTNNKQIRIESKQSQPQQSNIYAQMSHHQQQQHPAILTSLYSSVSSGSNVSPSSNSSICSSNSSTSSCNDQQSTSIVGGSHLVTSTAEDQSSIQISEKNNGKTSNNNFKAEKNHSLMETEGGVSMYKQLIPTNYYDEFTTLNSTHNDLVNQLELPLNTFISPQPQQKQQPQLYQQHQKKQPLLLPKPAPTSNQNNNNNHNNYNTYSTLIIPPVTQTPFISNSQISMMIPTISNGIISRSNSQPDLTISNLDSNFNTDMTMNSNYTSFNPNFTAGSNGMSSLQMTYLDSKNRPKTIRRHPSLSYKPSMAEYNEQEEIFFGNLFTNLNKSPVFNINNNYNNASGYSSTSINNNIDSKSTNFVSTIDANQGTMMSGNGQTTDDGLFLGTDALSDFISNCGAITDLFEDLPDLEDLMSLVTFESSSSSSVAALSSSVPATTIPYHQSKQQTQCDINLPDKPNNNILLNDCINTNPLSNYYDYCNTESSITNQNELNQDNDNETAERTTRSAPPSPTSQKKKQRPTGNSAIPFNKAWNKMTSDEQSKAVEYLKRIINNEMVLREQLEIIRILNPDTKLKPTDTQFIIDMKIIDDEKFKRIKDVIKTYGLFLNEKQLSDNSSDCSANSCPQSYQLAKRELRIKRAQQRMKLKQKKDQRQINKESKSGLFSKTEVVPLSQILPEEDIEIDILS